MRSVLVQWKDPVLLFRPRHHTFFLVQSIT